MPDTIKKGSKLIINSTTYKPINLPLFLTPTQKEECYKFDRYVCLWYHSFLNDEVFLEIFQDNLRDGVLKIRVLEKYPIIINLCTRYVLPFFANTNNLISDFHEVIQKLLIFVQFPHTRKIIMTI